MPKLAFPDNDHAPAQTTEPASVLSVVRDVPHKFVRPDVLVGLGGARPFASHVPVPETPVDENHGTVSGQNNVRLAGQVSHMEPEAVAGAVQQAADGPLRAGVLAPNLRHVAAALGFGQRICHSPRIAEGPGFHNAGPSVEEMARKDRWNWLDKSSRA